jgi:hypothetical protein
MRKYLVSAAGVALGLSSMACGGIKPGDYVVYRVAATKSELSTGCYPKSEVPPEVAQDWSSFRESGTIVLYAFASNDYYLDTGSMTLQGDESGKGYAFKGKSVDVEYTKPKGTGAKLTTIVDTTIDLEIDGAAISGRSISTTTKKCSGEECPEMPPACTTAVDFVGTRLDNVKIENVVANGAPAMGGTKKSAPPQGGGGAS